VSEVYRGSCPHVARSSPYSQPSAEGTPRHRSHCQHENREGARLCAACGSSFASKSPTCGRLSPPEAAFCNHCGAPLTGTTTAATSLSLGAYPQLSQAYTPPYLAEKIMQSRTALEGKFKLMAVAKASIELSLPESIVQRLLRGLSRNPRMKTCPTGHTRDIMNSPFALMTN